MRALLNELPFSHVGFREGETAKVDFLILSLALVDTITVAMVALLRRLALHHAFDSDRVTTCSLVGSRSVVTQLSLLLQ